MNDDFFEKVEVKDITKKNFQTERKNIYQIIAIILFIISLLAGLVLSVKDDCSSGTYSSCTKIFDFGYTLLIWSLGFISFLFMYGFGEIIKNTKDSKLYLRNINEKLKK